VDGPPSVRGGDILPYSWSTEGVPTTFVLDVVPNLQSIVVVVPVEFTLLDAVIIHVPGVIATLDTLVVLPDVTVGLFTIDEPVIISSIFALVPLT